MEKLALGIDIGGTNCAYGLINKNGDVIYENSVKTNFFKKSNQFAEYIKNEPTLIKFKNKIIGIGIGAPNGNHFTGEIQFAPNLPWEQGIIPIKAIFETILELPTLLTNDANAAAEGEKLFGLGKELKDFIVITLGTGLGSGIYINNELLYGAHGMAGELGHISVVKNGRNCKCGKNGCLETYASSSGIVTSYIEFKNIKFKNSSLYNLRTVSAKDIFEHAENNDEFANYLIEFTAEILGDALANFSAFSDPEAFILFGGISQSGEKFRLLVQKNFEKNILPIYKNKIKILTSKLHNKNAAILGNSASVFSKIKN